MTTRPQTERVLVVDDEFATRELLRGYLAAAGFDTLSVDTAEAALHLLKQATFPIVITDWLMPGLSGLELCRRLRERATAPAPYIIVLTVQTARAKLVEALDAGADDYLVKPCDHEELLARVRVGARVVRMHRQLLQHTRELNLRYAQLATLNAELKRLAYTDELTGLLNRREILAQLEASWAASLARAQPLACIMVDVDYFKRVNDAFGHAVGDEVLRATGRLLQSLCRSEDLVARLGGEEFLVVCRNTRLADAHALAERIRAAARRPLDLDTHTLRITVSLGVTERTPAMTNVDDLLNSADAALYNAKHAGRDTIRSARKHVKETSPRTN